MGTRADFYVGRGAEAEWLGSIAFDGYPDGYPRGLLDAKTEGDYRQRVGKLLSELYHATLPDLGWPWPWKDSKTTDYAYAWEGDRVWIHNCCWVDATTLSEQGEDHDCPGAGDFPNMEEKQRVTFDRRSGLIIGRG